MSSPVSTSPVSAASSPPDQASAEGQRAAELRDLLNRAAHAYYVLDAPVMEDPV